MSALLDVPLRPGDKVAVVDDSEDDALRTAEMLIDAAFEPVTIPLRNVSVDSLLDEVAEKARGLVCDHRLSHHASVAYSGAQVVAASNARGIPSVLISGYIDLDEHSSIRRYRSGIPRLLSKRFAPEDLTEALNAVQQEHVQGPAEDRKAYRTVVRVLTLREENSESIAEVIISAWDPKLAVALPTALITCDVDIDLHTLAGRRLMAEVNIYAASHEDLFFRNFEIALSPPDSWLSR